MVRSDRLKITKSTLNRVARPATACCTRGRSRVERRDRLSIPFRFDNGPVTRAAWPAAQQ
eukprot:3757176-Prymnesium_polylepis.1